MTAVQTKNFMDDITRFANLDSKTHFAINDLINARKSINEKTKITVSFNGTVKILCLKTIIKNDTEEWYTFYEPTFTKKRYVETKENHIYTLIYHVHAGSVHNVMSTYKYDNKLYIVLDVERCQDNRYEYFTKEQQTLMFHTDTFHTFIKIE